MLIIKASVPKRSSSGFEAVPGLLFGLPVGFFLGLSQPQASFALPHRGRPLVHGRWPPRFSFFFFRACISLNFCENSWPSSWRWWWLSLSSARERGRVPGGRHSGFGRLRRNACPMRRRPWRRHLLRSDACPLPWYRGKPRWPCRAATWNQKRARASQDSYRGEQLRGYAALGGGWKRPRSSCTSRAGTWRKRCGFAREARGTIDLDERDVVRGERRIRP